MDPSSPGRIGVVRGGCAAPSVRGGSPPPVACFRHEATESVAFDVARVLPPRGPVREGTEAVVIIAGQEEGRKSQNIDGNDGRGRDWSDESDLNASLLHLVQRLGAGGDCPWLTKAVFVVSSSAQRNATTPSDFNGESPPLGSVVDAFVASYLGDSGRGVVRPLPPDFTFPVIRTVLVLSDVVGAATTATIAATDVRLLPQGAAGALPNLDLVFAAYASLQSRPAGGHAPRSIYRGAEVRMHPFDGLEERMEQFLGVVGSRVGAKEAIARGYARDLAGMLGFVASLVVGPRPPHASALQHGIDALTIELRVPSNGPPSSSIHPHYADLVRCVEHLLRALSNLHERLHHSITQYTMPSPSKFVSHGEYVYPAVLVALPMVVRAAMLALRDLGRFRFGHVALVVGSVFVAVAAIGVWAILCANGCFEWISYVAFLLSYLLVVAAARRDGWTQAKGGADATAKQTERRRADDANERRESLRFAACLLGVYLHAPLLLANYALGFPSAVFWSPLLATLVLPPSLRDATARSRALSVAALATRLAVLGATCPPVLLVPRVFPAYTPYVVSVYTPLHLLLAALWLS